ncbi:hypothetical protein [Vibrio sp. R78045]|uniref:hypothetical protein n=1 Tax=Vibrio sp. R78045 TaxID=3093868 RepID=UPI0036F36155
MSSRNKQDIQLIFKHTHRDYRGFQFGEIMYGHPEKGTVIGSIELMPESVFQSKLAIAKRAELREQRDEKLKPILEEFGIAAVLKHSAQFRDTLEEVRIHLLPCVERSKRALLLQSIKCADITWL